MRTSDGGVPKFATHEYLNPFSLPSMLIVNVEVESSFELDLLAFETLTNLFAYQTISGAQLPLNLRLHVMLMISFSVTTISSLLTDALEFMKQVAACCRSVSKQKHLICLETHTQIHRIVL